MWHQTIARLCSKLHKEMPGSNRLCHGSRLEIAEFKVGRRALPGETGVTYKTAWCMFKQIRTLLQEDTQPLTGEVEVDETYVGGRRKGKRGRSAEGKTKVIGAVQRKGEVIAKVVLDVKRHTLVPFMARKVSPNAILYTDTFPSYDHMTRLGYTHLRIAHQARLCDVPS